MSKIILNSNPESKLNYFVFTTEKRIQSGIEYQKMSLKEFKELLKTNTYLIQGSSVYHISNGVFIVFNSNSYYFYEAIQNHYGKTRFGWLNLGNVVELEKL